MKRLLPALCVLFLSHAAQAIDGVAVEVGNGDYTNTVRAAALWKFEQSWFNEGDWHVTGFWEANVGQWKGRSSVGGNQTITDVGLTPVLRLEQKNPGAFAPYLEGGIGAHFISPTYIYANRKFGSSFQFGDHLGFGMRFGGKQQFDVGYRYQHLSNGGLKAPNQGINIHQLHFSYFFQ